MQERGNAMDFWDDTTLRLYSGIQHRERIAQGDAARRANTLFDRRTARARLATALVALAARLAPEHPATAPRGQAQHEQPAIA
jgi:hypothetical protein